MAVTDLIHITETGVEVRITPVSQGLQTLMEGQLLEAFAKSNPEPVPPTKRVNYGSDAEPLWQEQADPKDQVFRDLHRTWLQRQRDALKHTRRRMIASACAFGIDHQVLAELRETAERVYGGQPHGSDRDVYFWSVVCATQADTEAIADLVCNAYAREVARVLAATKS